MKTPKVLFPQGRGNEIMPNKSVKAVGRIIESSHGTHVVYCQDIYYCCAYCFSSYFISSHEREREREMNKSVKKKTKGSYIFFNR